MNTRELEPGYDYGYFRWMCIKRRRGQPTWFFAWRALQDVGDEYDGRR